MIGYLFALGSILSWGSFGLPLKYFNMKANPILVQIYFAISIFLSSWLVLIYTPFHFTWIGFIGAGIWIPCSIISFIAIKMCGLAVAQGTWSGFVIVVGFLWGALYFHEPIASLPLVLLGLFAIVIGVILISACNSQIELKLPDSLSWIYRLDWLIIEKKFDQMNYLVEMDEQNNAAELSPLLSSSSSSPSPYQEDKIMGVKKEYAFIVGVGLAIALGIGSGCMFVPTQFLPSEFKGENSILYVISFAIGTMVISFGYFLFYVVYFFISQYNRDMSKEEVKEELVGSNKDIAAGLLGGLFWAIGNFCATYAILYLGMAIGFPLTQANIVVSGLWGIFLLKEVQRKAAIAQFFIGTFLVLFGCFMLAKFS